MRHFDLCVIGSGSGNSIVDERFADWSVALVDDGHPFGGTCLNKGCIPTKMFVYPADLCRLPAEAARVDVEIGPVRADFAAIRDRIFGRIDPIAAAGERWRADSENVTLFREPGRFVGPKVLALGTETITADQFVIAAGSRATLPDMPGLNSPALAGRVHTSDTIMRLDELPASMIILGGGPVAVEFAHVFAAFGTRVTLIYRGDALLRGEDDEIRRRFTAAVAEYVDLRLNATVTDVRATTAGTAVDVSGPDGAGVVEAEVILAATGRRPKGDRLAVEAAGVAMDGNGRVVVDERQRTTAEGIWALGDVSTAWPLKHVANHEARVVAHNLLHPDDLIASDHRFVPRAVFGHPAVASVGLTEDAARRAANGKAVAVAVQEYSSVAYGWAMEDVGHCVKLIADPATRQLIGAHIIGPSASVLIQPLIQAMSLGTDIPTMARGQYWIHPALAEVVENALLALGSAA